MDILKLHDKVRVAEPEYGIFSVGEVVAVGNLGDKPVAWVKFRGVRLFRLVGFERYAVTVVNRVVR